MMHKPCLKYWTIEGVSFQKIDIVNWKEYPYHPEAAFRIAHTADSILIHYKVTERQCSCQIWRR